MLSKLKQQLVSFVFQPTCCFCDRQFDVESRNIASDFESLVCDSCWQLVTTSQFDRCYFCGAEINPLNLFGSRCRLCRNWTHKFERAIAIGNYRDRLKNVIVEIKSEINEIKALQLGKILGEYSDTFDLPTEIDFVAPVPSHWRRKWSRSGLHVAGVIAEGYCQATRLKNLPNLLKCSRFTKKQSKLRPQQRIKNVKNAFKLNYKPDLRGRRVLVIDDVMTSGATVNECTKLLLRAGVESVFVAVAARATGVS